MAAGDSQRPTYRLEWKANREGFFPVAGIDEAGCAPWAGPVVAAVVVFDGAKRIPRGINDSKKLTPEVREALYGEITAVASYAVGVADVARIDVDNILNARLWAMAQAVAGLRECPAIALIDGNRAPGLPCETRTVVGGDCRSLTIAAASIIAKVTRDRLMTELDGACPGYGFAQHKGYGTPAHQEALRRLGPSPHHRRSFAPVRELTGLFAVHTAR